MIKKSDELKIMTDDGEIIGSNTMAQIPKTDKNKSFFENSQQLENLVNNLPGMAYRNRMVDGKWKVEYVSKGVKPLLGWDQKYFMANKNKIYARIIEPEDKSRIWSSIIKAFNEQKSFEIIYRIKTASGKYKWVWEKGESIRSDTDMLVAMEGFIMDITAFKHKELHLQSSLDSASEDRYRFGNIIGKSPEIKKIYNLITTAGASDANTIIYGESGTGKELVARAIHETSGRNQHPIIVVNCGAIPEQLMESAFFGHKKGAFTGAQSDKDGFLSAADGGTLFLDEVGEISLELQVKLLRALDGYGFTPVGDTKILKTDVRIIAATNQDLPELVQKKKMRKDFYYRIHIIPITLPPLRERRKDIPLLVDHFFEKHASETSPAELPGEILLALQSYHWPGNIRELENVIQRYVVLGEIDPLVIQHLDIPTQKEQWISPSSTFKHGLKAALAEVEKQMILKSLEKNKWRRDRTAAELQVTSRTLYRKMMLYQIE